MRDDLEELADVANRIARREAQLRYQRERVRRWHDKGIEAPVAEALLATLESSLRLMRRYDATIKQRTGQATSLEGGNVSNRGALEPTDVKMMGAVLDAAWGSIQHAFHGQPQVTIEGGRTTLAKAVIDRVTLGVADTGVLKREAIRTVKVTYPHLPI